ncbi:MAG: hydrogenase 1 large subunit, partial [Anaerolineae bacterium]|nr:hydrogenase 1 large subunit [Anaerolineae bacterium]
MRQLFAKAKQFVEQVYIPDLLAVAPFYTDWAGVGEGIGNFMSYGEFPDASGQNFLPAGIILDRDLTTVHPVDQQKIAEYVTHSWYEYEDGDSAAKHPWEGETAPNYTGPKPPYEYLEVDQKYTWMKAPR